MEELLVSPLFDHVKGARPACPGLEGDRAGKSLHDLPGLSHTNLSSLMTVCLCVMCLLSAQKCPYLWETIWGINIALGVPSLGPQAF